MTLGIWMVARNTPPLMLFGIVSVPVDALIVWTIIEHAI